MRTDSITIGGIVLSPGLARGVLHHHHTFLGPIDVAPNDSEHNTEREFDRLDRATAKISDDLYILATRVEREIDSRLAEVFGAHKQILNDKILKEELRKEIVDNLASAGSAVKSVFLRWENRFLLMESQMAKEKSDDLRDISIRLRNALAGITVHPLEDIPENCVLVTKRLLPSDTIFLSARLTAAVLLEFGSITSHAALFTRQMGVPCLAGIPDILTLLPDNNMALVDGQNAVVTIAPNRQEQTAFKEKMANLASISRQTQHKAKRPAITLDGKTVIVNANIGCREDALKAAAGGADGIGLYRLEHCYLGRATPPDCDELSAQLRNTIEPFKAKSVCIRLLDIGADKILPYIGYFAQTNPALGLRGIRLLQNYPTILSTQLQAILALVDEFDIQILVPMVTLSQDMLIVKQMLVHLCLQSGRKPPKLGAMIETPAAALSALSIAPHADFMSFGTNDLTQYAFAADRENAAVADYFDDASAVIFRLITLVHDDVPDMPLSICGELAGRQQHIPRLLECGISSLSMAAPAIGLIKEAIRKTTSR